MRDRTKQGNDPNSLPYVNDIELKILNLLQYGMENKDIAVETGLSVGYVGNVVYRMCKASGFENRVELACWYVRNQFAIKEMSLYGEEEN